MRHWTVSPITDLPVVSDGEPDDPVCVLAVTDPGVRRRASAPTAGTMLLVVGSANGPFESSWNPAHFAGIRRPE